MRRAGLPASQADCAAALVNRGVANCVARSLYYNTAHSATRLRLALHPNA